MACTLETYLIGNDKHFVKSDEHKITYAPVFFLSFSRQQKAKSGYRGVQNLSKLLRPKNHWKIFKFWKILTMSAKKYQKNSIEKTKKYWKILHIEKSLCETTIDNAS